MERSGLCWEDAMTKLFTEANPKTLKGNKEGWMTLVFHMLPYDSLVPGRTVCPCSTPECRRLCLVTAGRGVFKGVQKARAERTRMFFEDRARLELRLAREIRLARRRAIRKRMSLAVRLNGTSDVPALTRNVKFLVHSGVRYYDYTKIPRVWRRIHGVHYTFSRSESNEAECVEALQDGINVAVVFSTKKGEMLPMFWTIGGKEYPVIDGDANDLRFLDPPGVIVGLRAKGRARKARSGFVVEV